MPHFPVEIGSGERERLSRLARDLLRDEPALASVDAFGPDVSAGLGPWPKLVLEDHSQIALFELLGDVAFSYRALLLAGAGDQVVVGVQRSPAFEAYCRETLGLGSVEILEPAKSTEQASLCARCLADPQLLGHAAARARECGGLNLVPYMGTGGAWKLAGRIAQEARTPVRVAAPPPRLTRRVNDKLWFASRVADVLGGRALPPAVAAHGPAALVGMTRAFTKDYASVAIKIPDSASSSGNIVLDRADFEGLSAKDYRDQLLTLLQRAGWRGRFPIMVTAWERPLLASPSVQLWIPHKAAAGPMIEGIFDQTVSGVARVFGGAEPTSLPRALQERLGADAGRLGVLFQELGYFGRCSFDLILVGESAAEAEAHWVECNGRWGGVSIPLTLANRLTGDWKRHPFVIAERSDLPGRPCDLSGVLRDLGTSLFLPGRRDSGAVILAPGRIEAGTGLKIMVFGATMKAARKDALAITERICALLGVSGAE